MSRGTVAILLQATQTFAEARAAQAAAGIAYYTLFSLFPLLLLLITFATSILRSQEVVNEILNFTSQVFPTSQGLVRENIQQVLESRGTVGTAAAIGLLWAATSVFVLLTENINQAWHSAKPRGFLQGRIVGVIIIFVLAALITLSLLSSTLFDFLPRFDIKAPLWNGVSIYDTFSWQIAARLVPWFFIFLMFLGLYLWVPNTKVHWSEAFWGALVATTAWEFTKSGFTWYLRSGLARYRLVYGSLGTVVALMLWIYLSSMIILFGAHLSAAITLNNRSKKRLPSARKPSAKGR